MNQKKEKNVPLDCIPTSTTHNDGSSGMISLEYVE